MSRLQHYINEVKAFTWEEISVILEKDCKPFLKEMKGTTKLLYRGVSKNIPDMDKRNSHMKDVRYPKDTPPKIHDLLNDMFYDKFKWRARNGVFVVGSTKTASHYGKSYIFFPIGKYRYVWSPQVPDLYSEMDDNSFSGEDFNDSISYNYASDDWNNEYGEDEKGHWEYDGEEIDIDDLPSDKFDKKLEWIPEIDFDDYVNDREREWKDERDDFLDGLVNSYVERNLERAIGYKHEISFDCNEYYAINMRWEKNIQDWL